MRIIRRLRPGDEHLLAMLAAADQRFDLDGRGAAREPLTAQQAAAFLRDQQVLFWMAFDHPPVGDETITGFLYCLVVPLRSAPGRELLLYEIGVHEGFRRRGIGTGLIDEMVTWMREHETKEAWVLADNPGAVRFYRARGFSRHRGMARYMTFQL